MQADRSTDCSSQCRGRKKLTMVPRIVDLKMGKLVMVYRSLNKDLQALFLQPACAEHML